MPRLLIEPDRYYTNGQRLVQVLTIDDEGVGVEDAQTEEVFLLTHAEFAAGGWREVEVTGDA